VTELYKKSGVQVARTILNVPSGVTVTAAYLAIKSAEDDTDADAVYLEGADTINNYDGYAEAAWTISAAALNSVDPGEYTWGIKAVLSNGAKAIAPDSIERIRIVSPFIEV